MSERTRRPKQAGKGQDKRSRVERDWLQTLSAADRRSVPLPEVRREPGPRRRGGGAPARDRTRPGAKLRVRLARGVRLEFIARFELLGQAGQRAALASYLAMLAVDCASALPEQPKALAKRLQPVVDAFARRTRRASRGPGASQKRGRKHERTPWDALADEFTKQVLSKLALTAQEVNAATAWRRQQVRRQATRRAEAVVPEFLVAIGRAEKHVRARRNQRK